jgi:hypothetical protein
MRVFSPNFIDAATITGSSRASTSLSWENVADPRAAKIWRTGTSSANESITFDLGASNSALGAIIFAHSLAFGDSAIELHKSSDNFVANDVTVGTFAWSSGPMILTFGLSSARYWRIQFTKSSAGVSRDIGRIFIGNYADMDSVVWDGFKIKPNDLSQTQRSEGGQTYSNIRPQFRTIKIDNWLYAGECITLKILTDRVGSHTAFFCQADPDATDESGELFYVKFREPPNRDSAGLDVDGNLAWEASMELEEQL